MATASNCSSNTWDAENRLVRSEPAGIATNGAVRLINRYDHRHRRIQKCVEVLTGRGAGYPMDPSQPESWDAVKTHTFFYDGWNLALETIAHANGTVDRIEYVWGLDLSGTLQGAGGVGGLLFEKRNGQVYIPFYDANGSITAYVDAYGNVRGHFEYDAFGNTIHQSGDMAGMFRFRFSTKYYDAETGLYYYSHRHYAPKLGCWFSKDPIGEQGGLNLYGMCKNNALVYFDKYGLTAVLIKVNVENRPIAGGTRPFLCVYATITESPEDKKCHVGFMQIKKPSGSQSWRLDSKSSSNPYYYSIEERIGNTSNDGEGNTVIEFNDSPTDTPPSHSPDQFYLFAVEVCTRCCRDETVFKKIRCKDKVTLLASRYWEHSVSGFKYTNSERLPTTGESKKKLTDLLNSLLGGKSWSLMFPTEVTVGF